MVNICLQSYLISNYPIFINVDPDPYSENGSGSTKLPNFGSNLDPDPQHFFQVNGLSSILQYDCATLGTIIPIRTSLVLHYLQDLCGSELSFLRAKMSKMSKNHLIRYFRMTFLNSAPHLHASHTPQDLIITICQFAKINSLTGTCSHWVDV